ncbi:stomatin-like protein 1 [Pelobates fuscus]|uniref:stomatin-like protein 1 n=1 Tax=Pelobates fuscus TaxID=191477 RepID=UPI002FE4ADA7
MGSHYKYISLPTGLDEAPPWQCQKAAPSDSWILSVVHTAISCLSCLLLLITFPVSIWCFLKVVPDYQRIVVFRLGRVRPPRGPGMVLLLPLIDQFQRVDMRTRAFKIPPSKVKSRDGAVVCLGADIQFRVCDPVLSVLSVQDLSFVIQNTAQNLLVQSLGRKYLQEMYSSRMRIGEHLKEDINEQVKPWGACVDRVDLAMEAVMQSPDSNPVGCVNTQSKTPSGGFEQLLMQVISLAKQNPEKEINPSTGLTLQQLLSRLEGNLNESLVSKVGSSFQFHLTLESGERAPYFLDLTSGSGRAGWGVIGGTPDVTLDITETDLLSLIQGKLHPLAAYNQGRLRVQGNLQTALQLQEVLQVVTQ